MGVEEDLLYRVENGVAWLTMNRPQVGNAMTPEVRDRMRDIINGLNSSYEARAIVITATGEKMFCPGADISTDRAVVRPEQIPFDAAERLPPPRHFELALRRLGARLPSHRGVEALDRGPGALAQDPGNGRITPIGH